jgi:hypothetical protein
MTEVIWEGDWEVVKRSGRDESIWVVTHFVHGNNARNLSIKLSLSQSAKIPCLSYYCLCLLFNKIREKGRTSSAWKRGGGRRWRGWGLGEK